VVAGVFGGWEWAAVTGAVVLFLAAFFWSMGQVGSWAQSWSRRLYGNGPDGNGRGRR